MKQDTYARELLDKLIALDKTMSRAYYEMGQILSAFKTNKLFKLVGYKSFAEMVEEELSCAVATATTWARIYDDLTRLHYNKAEALDFIEEFGWTNVGKILHAEKTKLGKRAMRTRIDNMDVQLNIILSPAEYDEVYVIFEAYGAEATDTGRLRHSSEAFMQIVRQVAVKKAA